MVNYDARMAADAEALAKQDRGGDGTFLSTRGGILALGEEQLPGNQVACVIVDSVLENSYYSQAYDPNNKMPPTCYAYTRGEPEEMMPHLETMAKDQEYFVPQNMADDGQGGFIIGGCKGCPMDEYGSAMRNGQPGRGKACKNTVRLALLPAGLYQQAPNRRDWELGLHDDPQHYLSSDVVFLSVPPTSLGAWKNYKKMLRVQHARAPYGAVTRVFLQQDPVKQFTVNFELIELASPEMLQGIVPRVDELLVEPFKGHEAPQADQQPPAAAQGRFGVGGNFRRR
ncbi:hypothetical protein GC167_05940 [bacterium]|nr:hypothetical protein [bacterium]